MTTSNYLERAIKLKEKMDYNQNLVNLVEAAGGINSVIEQSDKLGFDWESFYVNNVLVKKVYVAQKHPAGVEGNPIRWTPKTPLIQNAYYIHDGMRKVWTSQQGVSADWADSNFIEF